MIGVEETALVLLAAGRSERFGASKLDQDLNGLPLGLHAARALAALPFARRVAVTGRCAIDFAAEGYAVVRNDDPARDMASSVRLGVSAAGDAAAVLLVLADMPGVTAAHVARLFAASEGATVVASGDGERAMPPVLFAQALFPQLLALRGDHGARDLIRGARQVVAPAGMLVDVDTVAALEGLRSTPTARLE